MKLSIPIFPHGAALALLIVATLMPAIGHFISAPGRISPTENRSLAQSPTDIDGITDFTKKMDVYLNDNFGFRRIAVRVDQKIKRQLGEETVTYKGLDGWLFWPENLIWDSYKGRSGLTEKKIDGWMEFLKELRLATLNHGAVFAATIVPDKASIYSEYAPSKFGAKSSVNLHDYVMSRPDSDTLNLINIKPALLNLKQKEQIYFKTDTHWTTRGAYEGYRELARNLKRQVPSFKILPQQELNAKYRESFSGDLGRLHDPLISEDVMDIEVSLAGGHSKRIIDGDAIHEDWKTIVYEREGKTSPTIVVLGDSFSRSYYYFLERDFDKIVFIHHKSGEFDLDEIFVHDPDFVIFSPVERYAGLMGH